MISLIMSLGKMVIDSIYKLGIQIMVAEKKTKSTSPLLNNSGVIDTEEHILSESNWMKLSENQLKTPDSIRPQNSSPNHNNINILPVSLFYI